MLVELNDIEIGHVTGGNAAENNDKIDALVDSWIRNTPNSTGHHWEAVYTYDSDWNIIHVEMHQIRDALYA